MGDPPSKTGASKLRSIRSSPREASSAPGASGTVAGVTGCEASDSSPVPISLTACTVKVYAVPLVRPAISHGLSSQLVVLPPGSVVTV